MADAQSVVEDEVAATPGDAFLSLEAHIPGDRRRALATGAAMPDRVRGAALFADISGFTPLTEALANELGPQRGAEELTAHLNRVFHALIAAARPLRRARHLLQRRRDHLLARRRRRRARHGLRPRDAGDDGPPRATSSRRRGTRVRLAMKAAVAVGAARRFLVGDPDVQRIDVLAGRLIDELADGRAPRGEEARCCSRFGARRRSADRVDAPRAADRPGRAVGSASSHDGRRRRRTPRRRSSADSLPEEVVGEWLLPAVYERLRTGRGEFLAELRPAYPAVRALRRHRLRPRRRRDRASSTTSSGTRSGSSRPSAAILLQLTLGDKGAYLYAVFGSPQAHEDDAARAAAAALELRELASTTAVAGHPDRDHLWPAAQRHVRPPRSGRRSRASATRSTSRRVSCRTRRRGRSTCRRPVRARPASVFTWEQLPPITVKGKAEPVSVVRAHRFETACVAQADRVRASDRRPLGRARHHRRQARRCARWTRPDRRHFGRGGHGEVAPRRRVRADGGTAGHRRRGRRMPVVRHEHELLRLARRSGRRCSAWTTACPGDEQVRALEADSRPSIRRSCRGRHCWPGSLDLPIPDNDLTAAFDAKLRKTSLEGLLVECLRARAVEAPIVLVLEDCHWLDPLSRDLLEALAPCSCPVSMFY